MFDFHIHLKSADWTAEQLEHFRSETKKANVTGGTIISAGPASFKTADEDQSWEHRLESVERFTAQMPGFKPAFFIDPTDTDAMKQIRTAVDHGIAAFKIICTHFYPKDILKQLSAIAETKHPVIFHSGILYSMHPTSDYNRPGAFECLLPLAGLRFSLAHISWPWTDELTALFGQFVNMGLQYPGKCSEMFVDVTPGTPKVFRRDALRKFYLTNYSGLKYHTLWGTDSQMEYYNADNIVRRSQQDRKILEDIISESSEYGVTDHDFDDIWELISEKNSVSFFDLAKK